MRQLMKSDLFATGAYWPHYVGGLLAERWETRPGKGRGALGGTDPPLLSPHAANEDVSVSRDFPAR